MSFNWSKFGVLMLALAFVVGLCGCSKDKDDDDPPAEEDDDGNGGSGGTGGGGSGSGGGGGSGGSGGSGSGLPDLHDIGGGWSFETFSYPGAPFYVSGDVVNSGDADAGGFYVDFYASTNLTISTFDLLLGSVYVGGVPDGATAELDLSGPLPYVPAGTYYVGWIIDDADAVNESDETNNTVVLPSSSTLTVVDFEPNESAGAAWYLGTAPGTLLAGATIGASGDVDWFAFGQDAGFDIGLFLTSLPADFDVQIFEDDGITLLGSSTMGGASAESIVLTAPYTGVYYVKVYGFSGAFDTSDSYELELDLE